MPYGSILADTLQSSTAGTPPVFKDGNGTTTGMLCRAWVSFNGGSSATIYASFNVSSVTYNGTGDYTITFTNAMTDINYCVAGVCGNQNNTADPGDGNWRTKVFTTTTLRAVDKYNGSAGKDDVYNALAIFR